MQSVVDALNSLKEDSSEFVYSLGYLEFYPVRRGISWKPPTQMNSVVFEDGDHCVQVEITFTKNQW